MLFIIAMLGLSMFAGGAGAVNETILVATNRFVVLDDPLTTGKSADTAAGFALPSYTGWGLNSWSGAQTTIKGYALVLSDTGTPIANSPVVFTVRNWNSADTTTSTTINTDSHGIASYSLDLNAKNYYGKWYVDASATAISKTGSTGFIYNWFGCNAGSCRNHGSDSPGSATLTKQNSPYTLGREGITSRSDHRSGGDTNCVGCHRGYAGVGGGNTFSGQASKTADVHTTNTCATCHGITISTHQTNALIKSCSDCHSWTNLSSESTMSTGTTPMSNYSGNVAATGHNPNNTIPCIICHGPMHNITKPDGTLRLTKNSIVEDSHCSTCHTSIEKHNSSVNCTLCHSQDVHAIQVFSQSAGYVNKGSTYQGNCTNCHQNATFFDTLKTAPKAGSYSGTAPQVQTPLNHSTDRAGTKWGTYWTSAKDSCIYCHGNNTHISTRLGNAATAVGTDTIGGAIGTGTVCASCHNSDDSDYAAIMALLVSNPVAFKPGSNWNSSGTDHASYGTTDADCKSCHGGVLSGSASISEFVHNVDLGSGGGPDCVSCHDIGASQQKVDVSKMNNSTSIHNYLNSGATVTRADNKRCYACHTNSTLSADGVVNQVELPANGHPDKYNVPKRCTDCHALGNFSALIVKEHNSAGTDIRTKPYADTNDSCVNCHNKSEMILTNNDPAGPKSQYANVSHYGSNKSGLSPYNTGGASNCTYCHQSNSAFTTEMVNATWNSSISNHSALSTNPGCNNSTCHNTGRIHDQNLGKPTVNTTLCKTCHITKEKHNNSLECSSCHLATNKNIHPIQYLQPSGAFLKNSVPNKTSAVDCTSCHQSTISGFSSAAHVTTPLNHSNNNSGQKWGNFWTSQIDACLYCHGNSKHNSSGLGTALTAIGTDPIGGSIGSGTLCSSCHNSGDSDYAAIISILIPVPVANVPGTYYNSSGTNHGSYGTTDADCVTCHGSVLSGSNISEFPHNVASAVSGCTACHQQPPNGTVRNNTDGAHTLHKNASYGSVPETGCDYCHSNGGINEGSHPNKIYNITFNASVTSITHTLILTTGSDDTCSGVSCHSNGLSAAAKVGTAIWNSSTA
ncbi:MAG: hypothetical protein OIN87_13695, partial [Candidatus Methanoperedens sp.]|nr:hypothetical protein [Candidatus Methanoperedens sp.]